jgi:hypothetical protein
LLAVGRSGPESWWSSEREATGGDSLARQDCPL